MYVKKWFSGLFALALAALLSGCGNGSANSSGGNPHPQSNSVFVTATDAPFEQHSTQSPRGRLNSQDQYRGSNLPGF